MAAILYNVDVVDFTVSSIISVIIIYLLSILTDRMIIKLKYVLVILCFMTIVSVMKNVKMYHISTQEQDIIQTVLANVTSTKINKTVNDFSFPFFTQSQV